MIRGMEILISVGLLVAVAAWVAQLCHRLVLLRAELRGAWEAWMLDTRRRNETLGELAELFSLLMPAGEMPPRTLRRLVADSERVLKAGESLLWQSRQPAGEDELCRSATEAVRLAGERAELRGHQSMGTLRERLEADLEQQAQSETRLQLAAAAYNAALREPPVAPLAPVLGFRHCTWREKNEEL